MELELRHLRYLVVLSEELNFTRAAARLGLAQSALSAQVGRLERYLDVALFVRSTRSVRLTPAGEDLVARSRSLLADADRVERAVRTRAAQPELPAALRIVAETVHPKAIENLVSRHPGLAVTLRHDTAEAGVAALAEGAADVCHGWDLPTVPLRMRGGVVQATLVDEPMWAVLPADHELAGADRVGLTQLRGEAWVSPSPGTRRARHLQTVCQAAGFTPDVRYVVDDQEMVRTLLASGSCVDLAPPRHLPEEGCRAVPLVEDVRARLFFAWNAESVPSWLARELLEDSRQAFLEGLMRRGPRYAELLAAEPDRYASLLEADPVGWPHRAGESAGDLQPLDPTA